MLHTKQNQKWKDAFCLHRYVQYTIGYLGSHFPLTFSYPNKWYFHHFSWDTTPSLVGLTLQMQLYLGLWFPLWLVPFHDPVMQPWISVGRQTLNNLLWDESITRPSIHSGQGFLHPSPLHGSSLTLQSHCCILVLRIFYQKQGPPRKLVLLLFSGSFFQVSGYFWYQGLHIT